ncbi:hypothetical protein EJD97_008602, partial [Solanum chilense]
TARGPPAAVKWPPDQAQEERSHIGFSFHHNTPQDQPQNASKLQVEDAMESAIYDKAYTEEQKNISTRDSGWNRVKSSRDMTSTHQDLPPVQKLHNSTVPIVQNREAILEKIAMESPESRPLIRTTSSQNREVPTTGVCSTDDGAPFDQRSKQIYGQNIGGDNSGEVSTPVAGKNGTTQNKNGFQTHNTHVTTSIHQTDTAINNNNKQSFTTEQKSKDQQKQQVCAGEETSCNRRDTQNANTNTSPTITAKRLINEANYQHGENSVDQQDVNMKNNNSQSTNSTNGASNFSFAMAGNSPQLTPNLHAGNSTQSHNKEDKGRQNGNSKEQRQENGTGNSDHLKNQGKHMEKDRKRSEEANVDQHQGQSMEHMEQEKHTNKQSGGKTGKAGNQLNQTSEEYHINFPKISNNFTRYDHTLHVDRADKQGGKPNQDSNRQNHVNQLSPQPNGNNTNDQNKEPAPYTVVQSFAARLRYNQNKNEIPICLNEPVHTTRQGLPAVLIEENDYYVKLAEICKFTLVGKFTNTMPRMEQVRKSFILQTQLMGGVKITHFNSRHVYIDLDNELDYQTVWTKLKMNIEGQAMRIQAWTPDFTPEEETPIVPIWVSIPGLPWHCYNKVFLSTILESIGKVLFLDSPTAQRTRG